MSEEPPKIGNYDNVQPVVYKNGAHHLYEVDPVGGKKHVSSDEYLRGLGYNPQQRLSNSPEIPEPIPIPVVEANDASGLGATGQEARSIMAQFDREGDQLGERMDRIFPPAPPETIEGKLNQLEEHMNQRYEQLAARLGIDLNEEPARVLPPSETGPQSGPKIAGAGFAEQMARRGEQTPARDGHTRELGNRIGEPNRAEIRGQNAEGQPYIYRRGEDGQWEMSRNGDLAQTWFPATNEEVIHALGLAGDTPQPSGLRAEQPSGGPAEPAIEPEQTSSVEPEVDAEAMDEALAAALVAMESGDVSYAEARRHLERAIGIWRDDGTGGGSGNNNGVEPGSGDGNGGEAPTRVMVGPLGGPEDQPVTPQERRERVRRHGRRAIGALLVAGGLVGAFFLGRHFGHHTTEILPGQGGHGNPGEGAGKAVEHAGKLRSQELGYYGDTIWAHGRATLAQAMGGKLPKDWQVYQWCKETMNLPGNKGHILNSGGHWRSVWEGARHLPVGFHFRVSDHITSTIAR